MTTAREAIFQRIAKAKGASTPEAAATAYATIERTYQSAPSLGRTDIIHLFEDRLREYDAHVYRANEPNTGDLVAQILASRNIDRVLIPAGIPQDWQRGAHFDLDQNQDALGLNHYTAVLTTATLGIAETGTIVLQNAPGQGRRALTLVPDYHLCILHTTQVVETVVEAMRLLEPTKNLPTTFFSGPSATADIEMTRIKGVHGPRFVDVILIIDETL